MGLKFYQVFLIFKGTHVSKRSGDEAIRSSPLSLFFYSKTVRDGYQNNARDKSLRVYGVFLNKYTGVKTFENLIKLERRETTQCQFFVYISYISVIRLT